MDGVSSSIDLRLVEKCRSHIGFRHRWWKVLSEGPSSKMAVLGGGSEGGWLGIGPPDGR